MHLPHPACIWASSHVLSCVLQQMILPGLINILQDALLRLLMISFKTHDDLDHLCNQLL